MLETRDEGLENKEMDRMEPAELLETVNQAIYAIAAGGQSYRIGSRSLTRADLKTLYDIKNDLTAQRDRSRKNCLLSDTYAAVFGGR